MDVDALKELINLRFDAVGARFDGVDDRLDSLAEQVKVTNGRVRTNEQRLADHAPRIVATERDLGRLRRGYEQAGAKVPTDPTNLTKRDGVMILAGGSGLIFAFKFIEWAFHAIKGAV